MGALLWLLLSLSRKGARAHSPAPVRAPACTKKERKHALWLWLLLPPPKPLLSSSSLYNCFAHTNTHTKTAQRSARARPHRRVVALHHLDDRAVLVAALRRARLWVHGEHVPAGEAPDEDGAHLKRLVAWLGEPARRLFFGFFCDGGGFSFGC